MKKYLVLICTAVTVSLFSGCAWYSIKPIAPVKTNEKWEGSSKGYVFYQPELYFLVTPGSPPKSASTNSAAKEDAMDKESNWTVTPVYLPNPQKPYEVTTGNFLAKSDFTFNFKDGWQLTSIADKADNTTVANTIAGELKTILEAAGMSIASVSNDSKEAFLLKPNYGSDGIIISFTWVPISNGGGSVLK